MSTTPEKKLNEEIRPFLVESNEQKTREWNESISPRLESLRALFAGDAWKSGIGTYLRSQLARRQEHLERLENDPRADQFIKGQIAMLKQLLSLPDIIDRQIELLARKPAQGPRGDAGY